MDREKKHGTQLHLKVGESWPGTLEVVRQEEDRERRTELSFGLVKLFGFLLIILTLYGVFTSDQKILESVMSLTTTTLGVVVGYLWGKPPKAS